jgi:hydrogenase/urease accessory protein HupE
MTRRLWTTLLALMLGAVLGAVLVPPARAHEISMAEMELRQAPAGEFVWRWTAGQRGSDTLLRPLWPENCRDSEGVLRCGEDGLRGTLGMQGVGKGVSAVLVKVHWLDGQTRIYTLTAGQPEVQLLGAADDPRGMGEVARAYGLLGIEHILGGFDHLLFVLGLLFLVGFNRRLVWTITAFTVAHSLTLALSTLGWIVLRSPPVEATIALSILLVAGEALNKEQTLSRRWPALVALLFGLVHGLGFAGALQQIGLPQNHLLLALLTFNLGVEAGQLLVVMVAWVLVRALARWWPALAAWRTPALYAMGGTAAYWTWGRIAAIVA